MSMKPGKSRQSRRTGAGWYVDVVDRPARARAGRRLAAWLDGDERNADELARCEAAIEIASRLETDGELGWAFREARWLARTRERASGPVRPAWLASPVVAWSAAGFFAALAVLAFANRPVTGIDARPEWSQPHSAALSLALASTNPVVVLPGHVVVDAHSVAILPFAIHATGDERFTTRAVATVLHDDLVGALATIPGLYPVGGASVEPYVGTDLTPRDIAAQLGTRGVVHGTVASKAGRVRVTLRLIDASNDRVLLQSAYERPAGELDAIEREMASSIALALAHSTHPTFSASNQ